MADYVATSQGRIGYGLPQPYSAAVAYKKRDVVQYQGASYVVMLDGTTGVTPSDDGVHYRLLCQRGEPGESNAQWYAGTAVTGRGSGIMAGVPGSKEGDMYLNSVTSDLYRATAPDTWDWAMNIGEAVNVTAENVPTRDGGSVQDVLDDLSARTASDIPAGDEGESVLTVLDEHTAAIVDLEARTASDIPTDKAGVSVQDALDGKLPSANVVNNLDATLEGYALDARQGKYLNDEILSLDGKTMQATLLYQNASLTSSFPAQYVTLDLSQYTLLHLDFYIGPTSYGTTSIQVNQLKGRTGVISYFFENGVQASRTITISDNSIAFSAARQRAFNTDGTGWENNSLMIPYRIWGVKGV